MPEVLAIADAKKNFSTLIRESSESFKCFRVGNALRNDAPKSFIIGEEAIRELVADLHCNPRWEQDTENNLWSVEVPELDIFAQGSTREEAINELLETALDFALVYQHDPAFYFKMGRRRQYPYVLAVLLAFDKPTELRHLLGV